MPTFSSPGPSLPDFLRAVRHVGEAYDLFREKLNEVVDHAAKGNMSIIGKMKT